MYITPFIKIFVLGIDILVKDNTSHLWECFWGGGERAYGVSRTNPRPMMVKYKLIIVSYYSLSILISV